MSIEKKGIAVSHGFCYGSIVLLNQARTLVEKRKIKKNEIFNEIRSIINKLYQNKFYIKDILI